MEIVEAISTLFYNPSLLPASNASEKFRKFEPLPEKAELVIDDLHASKAQRLQVQQHDKSDLETCRATVLCFSFAQLQSKLEVIGGTYR
jgi:hypothetical protein